MSNYHDYQIVPFDPHGHRFEVTLSFLSITENPVLSLPAWIPGSYLIREFSRHIVALEAWRDDQPLAVRKTSKHDWTVAVGAGPVRVRYEVYAWDLSVRAAHLDATHAFFNGTSVFVRVRGQEHRPCRVDIQPPPQVPAPWRVATSLPRVRGKVSRDGFGLYQADDYDALVDHPVEMGRFTAFQFKACGVTHDVAVTGVVPDLDTERLARDMALICERQIRFFEPSSHAAPIDRYVFLVTAVDAGHGGLEHRASTALLCSRHDLPLRNGRHDAKRYRDFLSLVSHEYFHTWHVKRIKPAAFADYDLDREVYTRLLWVFEGFTSYYDELFLARTGLATPEEYFQTLAQTIAQVHNAPSHRRQSIADSSFDAWTKYYRPDENTPNEVVSYYAKGGLVALCLDLHIRDKTGGRRSLDDVMRALWQQFGRDFYAGTRTGLDEEAFARLAETAVGVSLRRQIRDWAEGVVPLPLERLLGTVGLRLERRPDTRAASLLGIRVRTAEGQAFVASVLHQGAGHRAGLSAGDQLVALDGLRVSGANLDTLCARLAEGVTVALHVFRRDELLSLQVTLDAPLLGQWTLAPHPGKAGRSATLRQWLSGQ